MLNKRVYLAGPIFGKNDDECTGWRTAASAWLTMKGFEPVDPMRRDYRGREDLAPEAIVSGDMEDILLCGYILANVNEPSWGTAMELVYGMQSDCTVIAFATRERVPKLSPWIRCHTDQVYVSLRDALNGITEGSKKGHR